MVDEEGLKGFYTAALRSYPIEVLFQFVLDMLLGALPGDVARISGDKPARDNFYPGRGSVPMTFYFAATAMEPFSAAWWERKSVAFFAKACHGISNNLQYLVNADVVNREVHEMNSTIDAQILKLYEAYFYHNNPQLIPLIPHLDRAAKDRFERHIKVATPHIGDLAAAAQIESLELTIFHLCLVLARMGASDSEIADVLRAASSPGRELPFMSRDNAWRDYAATILGRRPARLSPIEVDTVREMATPPIRETAFSRRSFPVFAGEDFSMPDPYPAIHAEEYLSLTPYRDFVR